MKRVGIADLKAHLSAHLRAVRRGQTLTVVDRGTPVARVLPIEAQGLSVRVRRATRRLRDVELPPPLRPAADSVAVLLEDRRSGR